LTVAASAWIGCRPMPPATGSKSRCWSHGRSSPTPPKPGHRQCSAAPTSNACGRIWSGSCGWTSQTPSPPWRQHLARLRARAAQLTELKLDALHFQGPGTDLTIGLIPQARWDISQALTATGQTALLNLPTEEVYTTPDRRRIDGVIRSTRPLALAGSVIQDLELAFAGGKVQTVRATTGADVVRTQQATDTGASMLGEVALVDGTSPIGQSGLTFLETLLDENATCHLAWGSGIPTVIPGWSEHTPEELLDLGVNQSVVHTDFMVGGPDVTVTGHRHDRTHVTILQADTWQLAT
jgi:aminopeptidase